MKSRNFFTVIALAATLLFSACNKTESGNPDDIVNNDQNQTEGPGYTYDESTNTYTINNANGLLAWNKAVQDDLSLNCTLSDNIDLTNIDYEWLRVGSDNNDSTRYTGTFEGGGYTITGLTIDHGSTNYVGLIGCLGTGGKVQNLTLENVSVIGYRNVGGVVGYDRNGTVTDCTVSGSVSGNSYVGGVVGQTVSGTVTACSTSCSVSGTFYVGGVVGLQSGKVTDCSASGNVTGSGSSEFVGGVVGYNNGTITNCTASGSVSSDGEFVGGVSGYARGFLTDCSASGNVSGTSYVGGVVGSKESTTTACSASGNVSGTGDYVGGVAGRNGSGNLTACYHTSGSVSGNSYVGGVVGYNRSSYLTACYHALGSVSGSGDYVGGAVGYNECTVTACYWSNYNGNGLNGDTGEATKVDGTDVTWANAVTGMNSAIETWNINHSGNRCDWRYELTGDLPTLTK